MKVSARQTFFFGHISVLVAIGITLLLVFAGHKADKYTASNQYCLSCHVHSGAENTWRQSVHAYNASGVQASCTSCHLPPTGWAHYRAKITMGIHDIWAFYTKDSSGFDWNSKRNVTHARKMVAVESCRACHQELITRQLSAEGTKAHLYFIDHDADLHCLSCHITEGHYRPEREKKLSFDEVPQKSEVFQQPAQVDQFADFTELLPGTSVSFDMVAIPGGKFLMGSPDNEYFRRSDEGPQREVTVSPFFMGRKEVTWEEYQAFYAETKTMHKSGELSALPTGSPDVDAISGPTPPYGKIDQGWGMGPQPAISMTWYAATVYCQWLSAKTGRKYRLPTEAEWEYACRGGKGSPYFFGGNPRRFSDDSWRSRLFGADTGIIASYCIYKQNSQGMAQAAKVLPNPFGLQHMAGNVAEFCSDWYSPESYSQTGRQVINPRGPDTGTEYVVRGGAYYSDAAELRSAARGRTYTDEWLRTDPQVPKSKWWYTDCNYVGFRVVCETGLGWEE